MIAEFGPPHQVRESRAVRHEQGRPAGNIHGAKRGDKWRDAKPRHEQSIEAADQRADQERHGDYFEYVRVNYHPEHGEWNAVDDQPAGDHAHQSDDRPDRKIDAPGENHESHANGEECIDRHVLGHDDDVAKRQEVRRQRTEEQNHEDQCNEGAQLQHQQSQGSSPAGCRRQQASHGLRGSADHL